MNKLIIIGNWISVLFFYIVCIVALKNMLFESYLTSIILFILICIVTHFYKNKPYFFKINNFTDKNRTLLWAFFQLCSFILMIVMTAKLRVNFSWDWGQLILTATTKVLTGEWTSLEYYSRYPNNQPWLLCLTFYFKIIQLIIPSASEKTFYIASIAMSIIFTQATLLLFYKTAQLLFEPQKALYIGIAGLVCFPYYLYAQFSYTDTISMLLVILSFFLYLKIFEDNGLINTPKKVMLFLFFIITSIFIFKIKVLAFIVIIAIVLATILTFVNWRKTFTLLVLFCMLFCIGNRVFTIFIEKELPLTSEMSNQYEFSWTHYLMMGMNHYGGYSQDDVDFTKASGNYYEKQKTNLKELKLRITNYGLKGTLNHLFYTKLSRTWGNSCLAGDDYIHRYPYHENSIWERLFGNDEDLHWIILTYTWMYHILLLFGIFIEAIFSLKNNIQSQKFLILRYTILGVGIFLTFWECNSRYLFPFLPLLTLLSAKGWENILYFKINKIFDFQNKKTY